MDLRRAGPAARHQYPDTSAVTYTYETTTSRLKSLEDALNQVKAYSYAKDNLPLGIAYISVARPGFGKPQF